MTLRAIPLLACVACRDPGPPPVPVTLAVEGTWVVVSQDDDEVALRFGTTGEGVRVWPRPSPGRMPGVTPVHDGRTLELLDGDTIWPLVAVAYPHRLDHVEIEVQGIDLVVRAYGPPLRTVSDREDAPDDPVITWVRLRPRPQDWRIVVDGLGTVSLPPPTSTVIASQGGWTWTITGASGEFEMDTNAPEWRSEMDPARWTFDTGPSLRAIQPYPRTRLTWTPSP